MQIASKVSFMKMKQQATGDNTIDFAARFYLYVHPPEELNNKPTSIFFNKNHSIGKVVDIISATLYIPYKSKDKNYKLHLILQRDNITNNNILPFDKTLQELENKTLLSNGQTVYCLYI